MGFDRPILHGLCTLGISVKLVMEAMAGGDHSRLRTVKVCLNLGKVYGRLVKRELGG